jgi:hypothetical protein
VSYGPLHCVNYKPPRIVRHRSARSLILAFGKDVPGDNEAEDWMLGDGKQFSLLKAIKKMGFWGFANTRGAPEVHWWAAKETDPEQVVALIAHELGHLRRLVKRKRGAPAEEAWADTYAAIAVAAFRATKGRR